MRLIEYGRLLGVVKVFNDGVFVVWGDYVVLVNDDVEFVGDLLFWVWVFM